jgi:hypothetical protein
MTEMGSAEFASRSPASSIRQRVRYSMGDVPLCPLRQMQPQGLNQHHVGEMLHNKRAAGLRVAKLGWRPRGPGMISDLDQMRYFET